MNSPSNPSINWLGMSFAGLALGLTAFFGGQTVFKQYHYSQGLAAYQQGDCKQAPTELTTFLQNTTTDETDEQVVRAKQMQKECEQSDAITLNQKAGEFDQALANIGKFSAQYPDSALKSHLTPIVSNLLTTQPITTLAKPTACQQLDHLKPLIAPAKAPEFYSACGKTLAESGDYNKAISIYENFLNQYPKHKLTHTVKQAYAQTLYDQAQSQGAGSIPQPQESGTTGDNSTQVEIRNDSPEKMRIVFGGPTPRVEELAACTKCKTYTNTPPKSCPSQGPVATYTVDPGQYRIVVKSIGGSTVTPYTGDWALNNNRFYSHCFYIVSRPLGSLDSPGLNNTNTP
jgi:outer membrane protein assembly factor BamD (BamD/ComL family)